MTPITNPTEALTALRKYEKTMSAALPARLAETLTAASETLSPVDAAVKAAEALYAFKTDLDNGGRELCWALTAWCNSMAFHNLGGERGHQICKAMLRDLKVAPTPGLKWPKPEEDPESDESYLVAAPAEAVVLPPAAPVEA